MFGETIEIIRQGAPTGEKDVQGNPIREEPTRAASEGWAVAPVPSGATSNGMQDLVGYTLYKPQAHEDIHPTDRVCVRGGLHAVEGVESDWDSPFVSGTGGVVVHVTRIS